jgi:hypothetical protein
MSGLWRASRVGPWLLLGLILRPSTSRLATETIRWPHASVLTVDESTYEFSEKKEG